MTDDVKTQTVFVDTADMYKKSNSVRNALIVAAFIFAVTAIMIVRSYNSHDQSHESNVATETKKIEDSTVLPQYQPPKFAPIPRLKSSKVEKPESTESQVIVPPKSLTEPLSMQKTTTGSGDLSWPDEPSPPFPPYQLKD